MTYVILKATGTQDIDGRQIVYVDYKLCTTITYDLPGSFPVGHFLSRAFHGQGLTSLKIVLAQVILLSVTYQKPP